MSIAIGKLVVAGGIKEAEGAAIRRGANEGVALVEGAICHLSLNANTFAIENITTQVPPDTSLSLAEQILVPAIAETAVQMAVTAGIVAATGATAAVWPVALGAAAGMLIVGPNADLCLKLWNKIADDLTHPERMLDMPGDAWKLGVLFVKSFGWGLDWFAHWMVFGKWYSIFLRNPVQQPVWRDPLVLDLNGDGIRTLSTNAGVYFDHDGNGFAERTGWVSTDDGLLVLDRNGDGRINDGRELFGDQTLLNTGQRAANGFEAPAEFDANKDGTINSNDPVYSQLRVWQDANSDGVSAPEELLSLNALGISAINTGSTPTNQTDPQGNTQTRSGTFENADGSAGAMGNLRLDRVSAYTLPASYLEVPDDIAALPDLVAAGDVYDLRQAMVRDSSGQLKGLVEQFVSASNASTRNALMDQILFKWTGSDSIAPGSRGPNIDARRS